MLRKSPGTGNGWAYRRIAPHRRSLAAHGMAIFTRASATVPARFVFAVPRRTDLRVDVYRVRLFVAVHDSPGVAENFFTIASASRTWMFRI